MANFVSRQRVTFGTSATSPVMIIDPRDVIVGIITTAAYVGTSLAIEYNFDTGAETLFATGTVDLTGGASGTVDGITVNSIEVMSIDVAATGTVDLTGGASGTVDSITVDSIEVMSSAEAFDTSLTITATNVAANITANTSAPDYTAISAGTLITITSVVKGAAVNGFVVTSGATTITTTDVNMSGGGAEAFDTSLTVTATNVAANITANTSVPNYNATSSGTLVTITALTTSPSVNGFDVTSASTTITTTDVNMSGGGVLFIPVYDSSGTQIAKIADASIADGRAYALEGEEWGLTNRFKLISSSSSEVDTVTILTKTRK